MSRLGCSCFILKTDFKSVLVIFFLREHIFATLERQQIKLGRSPDDQR